jgi:hypothetical protein
LSTKESRSLLIRAGKKVGGKEAEYMQACCKNTNQHVLTLHAGMYHHYMLVGKVDTCWLIESVHAGMQWKLPAASEKFPN